jgi:hypothetical protein
MLKFLLWNNIGEIPTFCKKNLPVKILDAKSLNKG